MTAWNRGMGEKKHTLRFKPLDLVRQSIIGGVGSSLRYFWGNNNGIGGDDERTARRVNIRHWRARRDSGEEFQLGRSPKLSGWLGCISLFLFTVLQSMQGEALEMPVARQETRFLAAKCLPLQRKTRQAAPLALKLSPQWGRNGIRTNRNILSPNPNPAINPETTGHYCSILGPLNSIGGKPRGIWI